MDTFNCETCEKSVTRKSVKGKPPRFCSLKCRRWKAGKATTDGYPSVYCGYGSGRKKPYVGLHVAAAEKALGRRLKQGEVVHHINGDKADSRNSNLLICTQSYHNALHARMSYLYQREHFG